jgi:hypothetical protein
MLTSKPCDRFAVDEAEGWHVYTSTSTLVPEMSRDDFVLRTVYLDRDLDDELRRRATSLGVSKAGLFRRYLAAGIKAARTQPALLTNPEEVEERQLLILRTVFLDPKVDDKLRVEAFDSRTSKNDLTRLYLRVGLAVGARRGGSPGSAGSAGSAFGATAA